VGIDIEPWEPEETVGKLWHAFASRLDAPAVHDDAAVDLAQVEGRLAVFFRGLGGARDVEIRAAAVETAKHRRSWRRRVAAERDVVARPSFDGAALRLPARIAVFPESSDNAALYFWLTAAAAHAPEAPPTDRDPLRADLRALRAALAMTEATLADCPGLAPVHARLCAAARALRPARALPSAEAAVEAAVVAALGGPAAPEAAQILVLIRGPDGSLDGVTAPEGHRPFAAVPLWPDLRREAPGRGAGADAQDAADGPPGEAVEGAFRAARRESDQIERRDSLILHKFEAIFAWADFFNINRRVEDDDPEGARKAAEDAEEIGLAQIARRAATRLRLTVDLSPEEAARERFAGAHLQREWEARRNRYLPDHVRVLASVAEPAAEPPAFATDPRARRRIRAVKRQFEALRPARMSLPRQMDGDEIDLDAVVRARLDVRATGEGSDRVWRAQVRAERSLAVSILLDASRSTETSVGGERSVIDIEREALAALAWGLDACGDEAAIHAFRSLRRDRVYVERLKGFDERMGSTVEARIGGLTPAFYTRLGAAVRHVSGDLGRRARSRRLLLVVTDGKPNDLDHYEGRHGIEDSRMAVVEARRRGQSVHGVIVGEKGESWFGRIFGRGGYSVIPEAERLTAALPAIYRHLVGA
jgi:nitric oxide reductase NorD protein